MADSREQNRAAFPETARMVDAARAMFGPDVALEWAEENGRTIGKKGPDGVVPMIEKKHNDKQEMGMKATGARKHG